MGMVGKPAIEPLEAEPRCTNLARRSPGKQIVARFRSPDGRLEVTWRAALRDGSSYVRPIVELRATRGRGSDSTRSRWWIWPCRGRRPAADRRQRPGFAGRGRAISFSPTNTPIRTARSSRRPPGRDSGSSAA